MEDDELCYYDHLREEIVGSMISKARRFNKEKCVIEFKPGIYEILPIEGYNTRTYTVEYDGDCSTCNCQHYVKNGTACSHIAAVALYRKNSFGNYEMGTKDYAPK